MHKTCLYILGYITYVFVRGVDALKANLLKKALPKVESVEWSLELETRETLEEIDEDIELFTRHMHTPSVLNLSFCDIARGNELGKSTQGK